MCRRVGSSSAVTVYLLGNHVFLECICSVLPEDRPAQTADGGVIAALNRIRSQWLNTVQTLLVPKSLRRTVFLKVYTHQEASLSHTSSCVHTCSAPWKEAVIQTGSRIKLWLKNVKIWFQIFQLYSGPIVLSVLYVIYILYTVPVVNVHSKPG